MPLPLALRTPDPARSRVRRPALAWTLAGLALLLMPAAGCQSTGNSLLSTWRIGHDSSLSPGPTAKELGDDRNFMARWLRPKTPPPTDVDGNGLVLGSDGWRPMKAQPNPEADAEFRAALKLFQQGKLDEAETAFATLAKKRKGSPWGEKGQYYLAETQFQRGKLRTAEDSFELLMKDYPGTEYNGKLVQREYEIAEKWLAQVDPNTPAGQKLPWVAHFDGRLPLIDTQGHAIRALEHVRHHHVDGPLADDAVMRIADEYMKNKDYDSAGVYYDQLVTDHPKSPFLQRAQLAGIDARMKGYLGPEYDGAGLEKARELIKQTMATNPDKPANYERLYHTLDLINDAQAERAYTVGDYYRRTGKVASAEHYFGMIPQKWPKSPWATKAKAQLAVLAKMPRKASEPSKIMTQPGSSDPVLSGSGGMMGMGGMGMGMGGMGMGGMGAPGGMM
jgi:outer membrane protein assembly factor BamD (BamD/ComL family)